MPMPEASPISVQVVDPPAFTPPYDHALCGGLVDAGAEVELITSAFAHGPVPEARGYLVDERFYGLAERFGASHPVLRRGLRAIEHVPEMLSYTRSLDGPAGPDVVHWQWLPIPGLDSHLLGSHHPKVFTMHWRLPDPDTRIARRLTKLLSRFDAVVSHTRHGARRLETDFGVRPERITVIPHGALDYLTRQAEEEPLPAELASSKAPVILAFGLIRPYKGTEVLIEALDRVPEAELWIVGKPMMDMAQITSLAAERPGRVRIIDRFVPDREIPAFMRRADVVCLPYRNIEQSGVLYAALAFGKPLVLSDVGGFPEIADEGAARLHPAGDSAALGEVLSQVLASPTELEDLAEASLRLASERYSWSGIGRQTLDLYLRLLEDGGGSPDNH